MNELAMTLLAEHRSEELIAAAERSARAPARRRGTSHLLTPREREVAVLAARGLSNREIAGLLVVSVRTIENQLYRVYSKLCLAGRDQLGTALGRPAGQQ